MFHCFHSAVSLKRRSNRRSVDGVFYQLAQDVEIVSASVSSFTADQDRKSILVPDEGFAVLGRLQDSTYNFCHGMPLCRVKRTKITRLRN